MRVRRRLREWATKPCVRVEVTEREGGRRRVLEEETARVTDYTARVRGGDRASGRLHCACARRRRREWPTTLRVCEEETAGVGNYTARVRGGDGGSRQLHCACAWR